MPVGQVEVSPFFYAVLLAKLRSARHHRTVSDGCMDLGDPTVFAGQPKSAPHQHTRTVHHYIPSVSAFGKFFETIYHAWRKIIGDREPRFGIVSLPVSQPLPRKGASAFASAYGSSHMTSRNA